MPLSDPQGGQDAHPTPCDSQQRPDFIPIPFDTLARIPLAPILIAQGLQVRRQAQSLPEPPGPRTGDAGNGTPMRLLITGDSSAAGVGALSQRDALSGQLVAQLAPHFRVSWRLEAKTGATTSTTLASLSQLPAAQFDVAVIALGVNDVTRATPRQQWIARQNALHQLLRDRFAVQRIFACAVPPMGRFPLLPNPLRWVLGQHAGRLDQALADLLAGQDDARHVAIDFPHDAAFAASDGFHPSPLAYTEWARQLADVILGSATGSGPG